MTGNTVYKNAETGISASFGSMVTGNTVFANNQSNNTSYAGIAVDFNCLVKGNTLTDNKQNNIYVGNSANVIEENMVSAFNFPGNGIHFTVAGGFYANNRAKGNSTAYSGSVPVGSGDGGGNASF